MPPHANAITEDDLQAHGRFVRALARSLVFDANVADDLEQSTWTAALERPPAHRGNLRAWLARVVRRRFFDHFRSERRRAVREGEVPPPARGSSPEEVLDRAQVRARLSHEVLSLQEPYRRTILLRFFEGLSARAIAAQEGVPVATVRTRIQRGLGQLRGRLERDLGPDPRHRRALLALAGGGSGPLALGTAGGAIAMATKGKIAAVAAGLALLLGGAYIAQDRLSEHEGAPAPDAAGAEAAARGAEPTAPTLAEAAPRAAPAPTVAVDEPALPKNVREGDPAGKGVIAGVVRDGDGTALVGAEVLLWDAAGRSVIQRVTTQDDGRFRFEALAEGWHRVSVHGRGKVSLPFRVRAGERLLEVTLEAAPRITGVVLEQGTDRPLEGISILARPQDPSGSAHDVYAKTSTDGTFTLDGLTAGSWLLNVGQFSITAEGPEAEFVRRRIGPVQAGGAALRVELVRGLSISGEIRGPDGAPWTAGASLRASPVSDQGGVGYEWQRAVRAAADGTFRLPGLSQGPYDVTVDTTPTGAEAPQAGLVLVRRVAAGTTGLVVELFAGRAIEGQVVDETGAAVTAKGFLWVYETGAFAGAPGSISVAVGEGGKFVSPALDPGRAYVVRGMGFEGYGDGELSGVHPGDAGVVVKLFKGRRISGRVVDAQGRPTTGFVPVIAFLESRTAAPRPDDGSQVIGATDLSGAFTIGGLQEGTYTLAAGGHASGWVSLGAQQGVLPTASPVVLRVERGVPLSGRLLDAEGKGVPYATVQAVPGKWAPGMNAITSCDAEGRFKFAGVPKGALMMGGTIGGKYVELGRIEAPAEDATLRLPK